jgi:hypothetical protein
MWSSVRQSLPDSTPASDVDDYFPHVSVSDGENSADQTLSKLSLPETTDWRSLDTVLPENDYPEKIAQERSAALAEPAMMMTPDLPDPSSNLENFDLDELEVAPSESPPPSRTPSPTPSGTSSYWISADIRRQFTCLACGTEGWFGFKAPFW